MAASIKHYAPNARIHLLHDRKATAGILLDEPYGPKMLFDGHTIMDPSDYTLDGKFAPGYAKTNLYDYMPFDHTIYLDVDGCAIKDVSPLFDEYATQDFASHVWGHGTLEQKSFGDLMYWADAEPIWEHYGLPEDAKLPFLNTSFLSVIKGAKSKKIYESIQAAIADRMPLTKMRELWGKGNQPDELYYNVGLAMQQYNPAIEGKEKPIYFRPYLESGEGVGLDKLREQYYFLGLWGGTRFNHRSVLSYYDGVLRQAWAAVKQTHQHKTGQLMRKKFVALN